MNAGDKVVLLSPEHFWSTNNSGGLVYAILNTKIDVLAYATPEKDTTSSFRRNMSSIIVTLKRSIKCVTV